MFTLEFAGWWRVDQLPPGSLFFIPHEGGGYSVALMTEYGDHNAYLVFSGETCCVPKSTMVVLLDVEEGELKESVRILTAAPVMKTREQENE